MNDLIPKSKIPAGKAGYYEVIKFNVSKEEADSYNLSLLFSFQYWRIIKPGSYTKLVCPGALLMSDTPAEVNGHWEMYNNATGDVLINGLGLGLIARAVLLKEGVDTVTINEMNTDVISLVFPYLQQEFGDRVKVNCTDALYWKPSNGEKFNTIWHDIWNEICLDNYEEYKKLMRRYSRWLKDPHWQGCWEYDFLKKERIKDKNSPWR